MDGRKLQTILAKHKLSGRDLARAMNLSERSIYRYFKQEDIKRSTIKRMLKVSGIDLSEYDNLVYSEQGRPLFKPPPRNYHQGENLKNYLIEKGINQTDLAIRLNLSRQTLWRAFKEPEIAPDLLHAVTSELKIDVSVIKGFAATNEQSNKDVLLLLSEIDKRLKGIEEKSANPPQ